VSYTNC